MPNKHHSSARLTQLSKRHSSHTNIVSGLTSTTRLNTEPSPGGSQSTLVLSTVKSKASLHKKRPSYPARKDSTNAKQTVSVIRKKSNGATSGNRQTRKGAFRGALDGDGEEDEEENEVTQSQDFLNPHPSELCTKPGQEEEWVSEPSTRCATPTAVQPPNFEPPILQYSNPQLAALDQINLAFQLPNPLSSGYAQNSEPSNPSASPLPSRVPVDRTQSPQSDPDSILPCHLNTTSQSPTEATNEDESEADGRGRSRSRNRVQDSIERVQRLERSRASNENGSVSVIAGSRRQVIEPAHQPPHSTRDQKPVPRNSSPPSSITSSASNATARHDSKGKGVVQMNSKRASRTTSIHSNRSMVSLMNLGCDPPNSKLGIKRAGSTASLVLQPKIDTTEAFVSLTSKTKYNLTLTSIEDLAMSTSPTLYDERKATCDPSDLPSSRATSSSSHLEASISAAQPSQPSETMSGRLTTEERLEFANRLKKVTNLNEPYSPGFVNSILSPRINYKNKKPHPHVLSGSKSGYFGSIKNFVGSLATTTEERETTTSSTLAEDPTKQSHGWLAGELDQSSGQITHPVNGHHSTAASTSGSSSRNEGSTTNAARHGNLHFQLTNAAKPPTPKPLVKGLITTCGSVPVVSRFLGPVLPTPSPMVPPTSIMGGSRIGGASKSTSAPSQSQSQSQSQSSPSTHRSTSETPSLSRIQQRLLMERDRPVSPTFGRETTTTNQTGLPPPSYLIRSLGGQTGPLPFMPIGTVVSIPTSTGGQLNEPAMRAKVAVSMRMWRSSLIDEVEQVWSDHESRIRWRDPWIESLNRVTERKMNRRRIVTQNYVWTFSFSGWVMGR
ncbi:uncharacterized protein MELLADRAFT_109096 [Melampsora larici-populina 98AG31]|uniref:Uncharacterized protein n=1 Tax=Melampsora larici-populina (strain 98AG31 / pathotype 3-4-7) TaxID=747676 RepID=F4RVA9_MELLP|nr:uncharacterized protein MELLADRAFT_109096 [Melampsora larici-populina 98AG31]EGG03589.1 hypothetical protein MELLADRAFT_109096 [Melampsora larici-populina 98AG31]